MMKEYKIGDIITIDGIVTKSDRHCNGCIFRELKK